MFKVFQYYAQAQGAKGRLMGMSLPARLLLTIVALPGLVLAGLSLAALLVSLLALLLMTVPVYRLLSALGGSREAGREVLVGEEVELIDPVVGASPSQPGPVSSGPQMRRPIEVKIVD